MSSANRDTFISYFPIHGSCISSLAWLYWLKLASWCWIILARVDTLALFPIFGNTFSLLALIIMLAIRFSQSYGGSSLFAFSELLSQRAVEFCQMHFSISTGMIMQFFFFSPLTYIMLSDFLIVYQPCILAINSAWS